MRMNLRTSNRKIFSFKNIKFNSKNLFVFLISLSIVAFILGIVFFYIISSSDKELVNNVVMNNFKIKDNYNYLLILKDLILSNTYNTLLIWLLGISVIGIIANIFIYFFEIFSIGFTISSLINIYKSKSIIAILIYLFPTRLLYIITMFMLTYFSIKFSYKIISVCFLNKNIDLRVEMKRYFKVLLILWILVVGICMFGTFVDPILINFFTKM